MADYTAIHEAASGLVEYLRDMLTPEPISKRELVSLCSPYEPDNNQLTVYMYSIEEDPAIQNTGYQAVSYGKEAMQPTNLQAGILITAHSNAPSQMREADRYRIIGAAIQAIKDMPVLDRRYLTGSLGKQGAEIRIEMQHAKHEEMVKIWNNSAVPYKASIALTMTGIEIESKRGRSISRVTDVVFGVDQKRSDERD